MCIVVPCATVYFFHWATNVMAGVLSVSAMRNAHIMKNDNNTNNTSSTDNRNVVSQQPAKWPRVQHQKTMLAFIAALVAVALICAAYPAVHMTHAVVQEILLAGVVVLITWNTVGMGSLRQLLYAFRRRNVLLLACQRPRLLATVVLILVAAAVGGSASFVVSVPSIEYVLNPLFVRVFLALMLCLFTGVFEECLFRGLAFVAFCNAGNVQYSKATSIMLAALLQAALFACMHVSVQHIMSAGGVLVVVQAGIKLVQAFLFGLVMVAVAMRTQGLWCSIVLHVVFDCLYLGPALVMGGVMNIYHFSGTVLEMAIMLITALLLLGAWCMCRMWLHEKKI